MHIYSVVSIAFYLLFLIEQNSNSSKFRGKLFYVAAFISVALLAFRGIDVGGDTLHYCGYFTGKGGMYGTYEMNDSLELGFRIICSLLMLISRSEFWFILSTSLITMIPFIYLIHRDCKYSKVLPLALYMTVWGILSVTQTAVRQNMAVSLMFLAYIIYTSEFRNEKLKYGCIIIVLTSAFFTHTSSLVAIPLLTGCMFLTLTRKKALTIVIGTFVVSLLVTNLFGSIFEYFTNLMGGLEMASRMVGYYGNERYALANEISFNRLGPTTLLVCLLITLSKEEDMKSFYIRFLVIGSSLFNIGASFPMISRATYPLLFLGILYNPSGLSRRKNIWKFLILLALMAFFIKKQLAWAPNDGDKMLPYTFIWE